MPSYLVKRYRAVPPMKAGQVVGAQRIDAGSDESAIAHCQAHCMADFDALCETVYVWHGVRFVWGHGIEAGALYETSRTTNSEN